MRATDSDTATFDPFAGPAIALSVSTTEPQREVWTATQIGRDASLSFNEAAVIRLRGPVHVAALRQAISDLFARHEALRATFSPDGLTLLLSDPAPVDVALLDLRTFSDGEAPALRAAVLRQVVTEEFDLERGPLARCSVVQLSEAAVDVVFSAHHIVCDGWSFGVLAGDLAALYNARLRGGEPALPAAARFSDYARESVAAASAPERADDERYWLAQFSGALPVLDLPSDRPRPAQRTFAAGREDRVIPANLAGAVRAAGAKAGSSMFVTLLGAFATLVHRLSGQEDLVIGVPSAGQSASGQHGLVGHCVNMLPMRIAADARTPFDALLAQVRSTTLDAFEHQGLGFGSLLERLPIPRDPSRSPLVSVIFNVDRPLPPSSMPFEGITAELQTVPRAFENFDLFLNAIESDAGIVLECQYNSALHDGTTVRRWLESFEVLLHAVASASATPLGALPILTPADRAALDACNDTTLALPAVRLVHHMVGEQMIRTPASVAVQCDATTLTYAELDARANRLAHHLRAHGARRGTLVGLCLDRTPDLLVSLLAILRAGAGYVPLDPNYPADRLAYMADDAALAVLVTDVRLADELHLPARAVVRLDADAGVIAAQPAGALAVEAACDATPDDTAYVIYTSGSTGRPKGVLVPHRAVVNLLCSVQREPGLSSRDTVLAITTLSFDIAVSEVLLPLTVGARIVLASRETASDGPALLQLIESTGVTFIDATPATYRLLLSAGWQGSATLRLVCTGEAMPRDLAQALTACAHEVWNGYGPTETTVWSTFARVQSPVERVLIGRPVANTRIAILDALGQQVPVGVAGELFIAGEGVTTGYLNRPDLTTERFLPDPEAPGRLRYRTGDLVRLLPSGELECLGRNDNQVKVRGFRIEPGEIEVVLGRWPGVTAAVVIAREDRANDVRLVAYLVTESDEVIGDELRAFVRASLPDFMVPNTFVRLPALPLTPSGKVDRKALPAPQVEAAASAVREFVAARSESETIIATLWAEALGVARVSMHDDFFALGGHSLLASQVLSRLRRDHGVQLSFRTIFEAPTVAALAAVVDARRTTAATAPTAEAEPIRPRADVSVAPLSVLQERLWMLEELQPSQRSAHAHSASWLLRGELDLARMERALHALTLRHATLRTSFRVIDGARCQVIAPDSNFVMRHLDLSRLDDAARQAALVEFFRTQQFTPFELETAPLFRAIVVRLSADSHLLYTLQHGMVWDGWSFDLFLRDVTELYAADEAERAPKLEPLPVAYGDFAAWQAGWLAGAEAAQQGEWWRTQLAGDPPELLLQPDHPRPEVSSHAGGQVTLAFSPDEAELLRNVARTHDSTLFMVLFAAYNVLLHRYSGLDDLLVGSPVRARTRPELEHLIGPFVNTVLLRTRIQPGQTFAGLLTAIRDVTLDSFSHQELPFERLGARVPPVRVLFSMQDARERPVAMGTLGVEQYHVPQHFAMNDMMLWMMESRRELIAVMNYSTELFERSSAELFLAQLRTLLLAVVSAPTAPISSYDLTTPGDLAVAAPAMTPMLVERSVPELVRQWAEQQPDRVAVRSGRESLTYGALTARARHVVGTLATYGAGPGRAVAIALPHGVDRIVAIVAAMKRGCPVLLLDPADADAWLERAIRAADAAVCIAADDAPVYEGVALLQQSSLRGTSVAAPDFSPVSLAPAVLTAVPGDDGTVVIASTSALVLKAQVRDLGRELELTRDDVHLAVLPSGAPGAVLEIMLPLAHGATLVLASDDAREDARDLADEMDETGASLVLASGEAWRTLLATPWKPAPGFRAVIVSGGLPVPSVVRALAERVPRAFTLFGQIADGGASAVHRIAADDAVSCAGVPLAAAHFTVVDQSGGAVATGLPGVLRVGTTASPLQMTVRARRAATGRIQLLEDDASWAWIDAGVFHVGAVEAALCAHPAVADAAVAAHRDAAGTLRVVAYVVARPGTHHTDTDLRNAVRTRLPRRCVPQRIVSLPAINRAADGSVVRHALPIPFAGAQGAGQFIAPRTPDEALLAAAWQQVLGLERVSTTDNFFRLGGTSLLCFRVVEQVRRTSGKVLNPRALLVGTLEQAAAGLGQGPPAAAAPAEPVGMLSRLKGVIAGRAT